MIDPTLFPPIHLYAILGSAIAIVTSAQGRKEQQLLPTTETFLLCSLFILAWLPLVIDLCLRTYCHDRFDLYGFSILLIQGTVVTMIPFVLISLTSKKSIERGMEKAKLHPTPERTN